MFKKIWALALFGVQWAACAQSSELEKSTTFLTMNRAKTDNGNVRGKTDTATFGAGCFWCTEAQFRQLKGVVDVQSGFMGGTVANPTYKQVCTGSTGHAEVSRVYYDPAEISFDELLPAFFIAHDPTQLNRQGNDEGTQYRSVVFYHNGEQEEKTKAYIRRLNEEKVYPSDIVTEVSPASVFYLAEDYHQDYYRQNGSEPYCRYVIQPKLEKFRKVFKDKIR